MPLLGVAVTAALMHRGTERHKELAQTVSLLLAWIVGSHGANGNGEKPAAAMPLLFFLSEEILQLAGPPKFQAF